jgi:hypothetical protein
MMPQVYKKQRQNKLSNLDSTGERESSAKKTETSARRFGKPLSAVETMETHLDPI